MLRTKITGKELMGFLKYLTFDGIYNVNKEFIYIYFALSIVFPCNITKLIFMVLYHLNLLQLSVSKLQGLNLTKFVNTCGLGSPFFFSSF